MILLLFVCSSNIFQSVSTRQYFSHCKSWGQEHPRCSPSYPAERRRSLRVHTVRAHGDNNPKMHRVFSDSSRVRKWSHEHYYWYFFHSEKLIAWTFWHHQRLLDHFFFDMHFLGWKKFLVSYIILDDNILTLIQMMFSVSFVPLKILLCYKDLMVLMAIRVNGVLSISMLYCFLVGYKWLSCQIFYIAIFVRNGILVLLKILPTHL